VHEFALAQAVIDAALQAAGAARISRITRISVRIGELQEIESDCFEFALKQERSRLDTHPSAEPAQHDDTGSMRTCGVGPAGDDARRAAGTSVDRRATNEGREGGPACRRTVAQRVRRLPPPAHAATRRYRRRALRTPGHRR